MMMMMMIMIMIMMRMMMVIRRRMMMRMVILMMNLFSTSEKNPKYAASFKSVCVFIISKVHCSLYFSPSLDFFYKFQATLDLDCSTFGTIAVASRFLI